METTATPAPAAPEAVLAPPPTPVVSQPLEPAPVFPEGTLLREYETVYLTKPDMLDDAVDKLKERMRALVVREGGKVIKFAIWGKKKTQYEVAKGTRAIYVQMHYLGPSKIVAEVERNLRMIDDVIRYQTVKIAEETDANKPVEPDTKLAGDADQPERPPREERERSRDDFEPPDRMFRDDRDDGEPESA